VTLPANALMNLLQPGRAVSGALAPTSRYAAVGVAQLERLSGEKVAYLRRRILPLPDSLAELSRHTVRQGERLDRVAAAELNDPELFWRLLDANPALSCEALEVTGRRLRVTLPEGMAALGGGEGA
jgi:hypothetical protein